jgi:outer membrane receptor protein involved in Fe transport
MAIDRDDDFSLLHKQGRGKCRRGGKLLLLAGAALAGLTQMADAQGVSDAEQTKIAQASSDTGAQKLEEIVVTASRRNLIGTATTASQGSVTREELQLRPVYRVGQLLESVPGLIVTVHSGEAKAYQYLLRGVNLDHGIDFANFVDDMPVNRPSNAHGQGYSDLNFVIPQILAGVDYTKGPYFAALGDFGSVGSEHMRLVDDLPDQISASAGTLGDDEVFAGGTLHFDDGGKLLGAADVSRVDGPYTHPDNFRKIALATRYSQGTDADGYSLTAMYYKGQGRFSTDQPLRAIQDGVIGFYSTLDPTDGARSSRWSLSGHYGVTGDDWKLATNAYAIHSTQVLWNNFTHFLFDPVNGDQEQQDETRDTFGGGIAYTRSFTLDDIEFDTTFGVQERYDTEYVDRRHTRQRVVLDYCNDGDGDYSVGNHACTADLVNVSDTAPFISNTTHWLSWLRSTVGIREEYANGDVRSVISSFTGSAQEFLFQPKGSVTFGPWYNTEFYVSAGKGFHSDDIRGVVGSVPLQGTQLAIGRVPLLARTYGEEFGIRNASIPGLQIQLALFRQDYGSEEIYDQDAGMDQATAPSRRQGFELSAQYHPFDWLELNTDVAVTKARFFKNETTLQNFYRITGGSYIANAPSYTLSFGAIVDNLGPWFGGAEMRILGPYPLTDGPANPRGSGYTETNIDIGYRVTDNFKVQAAIFNLFNQKAYSSEFYYATNIDAAEVAKNGTAGVNDYQVHPLEPISARFTLTYTF